MSADTCFLCDEAIGPDDQTEDVNLAGTGLVPVHFECSARGAIGSVGHQKKRCSCYGGTEDDPPGMTKRQAARAALDHFRNGGLQ